MNISQHLRGHVTDPADTRQAKCPKCGAAPNVIVVPLRARNEDQKTTVPILQFLCDECSTILSVSLDPEWQAQIMAGQLRTVGDSSKRNH
jgi:hypothetical protein